MSRFPHDFPRVSHCHPYFECRELPSPSPHPPLILFIHIQYSRLYSRPTPHDLFTFHFLSPRNSHYRPWLCHSRCSDWRNIDPAPLTSRNPKSPPPPDFAARDFPSSPRSPFPRTYRPPPDTLDTENAPQMDSLPPTTPRLARRPAKLCCFLPILSWFAH